MLITVKSFDGHNINDGSSYLATGLNFGTPSAATLQFAEIARSDSIFTGAFSGTVRNLTLSLEITGSDRTALEKQLKVWLKRGSSGNLVATFSDDSQDYQIACTVQSLVPEAKFPGHFILILQAGASSWRRVTAETDTWTAAAGNLTKEITVGGVEDTRLIASITPTAAPATGWQYQYLYQLINKAGFNYGFRPWCITIDTAALVAVGKLRADCYDLRVVVNDIECPRWIADANTDHTHVWVNLTIGPGYNLTLKTPVPDSGAVGELQFAVTNNNLAALKAMPASGFLLSGGEWFKYSGKNISLYKLGIEARGALGTALAAHVKGATFQYIQNVVFLLAGNSAAADPAAADAGYDLQKPVFDLSASNNTQWAYTATTQFYDPANPSRPGSWKPTAVVVGKESKIYEITQDLGAGAPALGMLMATYQRNGVWKSETATLAWEMSSPSGIVTVTAAGQKYRSTSRWPAIAALRKYTSSSTWANLWTETAPVNPTTWTAFVHNNQATTGAPKRVQFVLKGTMLALADAAAYFELLTATVAFENGNLPAGSLLVETGNYPLSITLSNTANGDAITVTYPMLINKTLLLDGENFVVTVDGVAAQGAVELDDPSRDVWIRLAPGANTLSVEAEEMGTLDIDLSWYPRQP